MKNARYPKPGDRLLLNPYIAQIFGLPREATVLAVKLWEDSGPLTAENHGTLDVEFSNGAIDQFVVYEWDKTWSLIE